MRGLVITGGHDHETSFYTLFDGYKDLAGMPVTTSATAFKSDLRGKYDVVIMYDFSRDLDETGKKNLRDFVESGKGIVVLHHALLNYQEWPWWYKEVVGGSYRLKNEGNVPSSTVKDNQQFFVTPQGEHPVTAGIDPFHIVDEAYKRMWFSAGVRPLLVTDNANSDRSSPGSARAPGSGWSRSSLAMAPPPSAIPPTGPLCTTRSSGRRDESSDGRNRGWACLAWGVPSPHFFPVSRERGIKMKLGLYSITYLGLWYRGEALPLPQMITRAKKYGYDGIEIDGKRPHGNPLDWPAPAAASCVPWPTAKGSTSSRWRPTTTSATRFPRFARPRSASCATSSA